MSQWQAGYVSDIEYTAQFYRELSPDYLNTVCLLHGNQPPAIEHGFTYCELGCGQAISTLMLASMYPKGRFYAVDFNPSHIANAKRIADQAGIKNIHLSDMSFGEVCDHPEWLPACDYIVYHGIYSWVSAENRRYLQEITGKHLKPGGLVYNSYNCMPGWATQQPLQHMLRSLANTKIGRSDQRIAYARDALKKFVSLEPVVAKAIPQLVKKLDELEGKPVNYLVHEYLHDSWKAFYASEVINDAEQQKLTYVGQVSPVNAYERMSIPEPFRDWLKELPSQQVRQDFVDSVLNNQFRRDFYLKGATAAPVALQVQKFRTMKFVLMASLESLPTKVTAPVGELNCNPDVYRPVMELIANESLTLDEMATKTGIGLISAIEVVMVMMSAGSLYPVSTETKPNDAKKLNRIFAAMAEVKANGQYLCAPNVATGIAANHLHCLFMHTYLNGNKKADELVSHALLIFQSNGFGFMKEGKQVTEAEELKGLLATEAENWLANVKPIWQELGIF